MNMDNVKAILFDSGRTLNVPSTGYWFITPNFFNILNEPGFQFKDIELEQARSKARGSNFYR